MTTTVIGAFDDSKTARKVMDELLKAGCRDGDIEVLEGSEDEIRAEIVDRGFDRETARTYAEAIGRGKTLVAARAPDDKADHAMAIVERYESSDGGDEEESGGQRREAQQGRSGDRQETVAEVEEELAVEKHKVARGGVRVTSHVSEQPVQETVRLREERVEVDRRPVDRKLSPEEADAAFEEKTVEMTETGEEVEVRKEARVVEEVSLNKRTEEHQQKVRDKVRRTDVEVEEIEPSSSRSSRKGR